ncbi:hypothetical protein LF1_19940 [Rubripirellula obstinata]|uniref:Uncharacterized protein n=1 Tax=Rubripirellula obstinata TaxID=406547 RepID=A0A5B1CIM5_9BACT|nr:hypothetical protein LF1_19940 [Rubripirellula obstinata]
MYYPVSRVEARSNHLNDSIVGPTPGQSGRSLCADRKFRYWDRVREDVRVDLVGFNSIEGKVNKCQQWPCETHGFGH